MPLPLPIQFMLLILAGWVNRQQCELIEYLQAENRVLREQQGANDINRTGAEKYPSSYRGKDDVRGHRKTSRVAVRIHAMATPDPSRAMSLPRAFK